MEYEIPANVIEFTPAKVEKFKKQGYPISNAMIEYANNYTLPKLDDFFLFQKEIHMRKRKLIIFG